MAVIFVPDYCIPPAFVRRPPSTTATATCGNLKSTPRNTHSLFTPGVTLHQPRPIPLFGTFLDSNLPAGLIQYSKLPWAPPLFRVVPKKFSGIRMNINYQKLNSSTKVPNISTPARFSIRSVVARGDCSVFDLFSGFRGSAWVPAASTYHGGRL